ncbi:arrestin homolog isoform X1 [Lutzomyia longipalpis]|uniref:arrestin homolog isoform X1 n=1 Tax=Lutzomyia longipalpis TaxID=7200 RepID=UPI002483CACF|nr:arrestin homolog isoform X1 [Lutzomyia longipalpis]
MVKKMCSTSSDTTDDEHGISSVPPAPAAAAPPVETTRKLHLGRGSEGESFITQRVYKKTSSNAMITLYLASREMVHRMGSVEPLRGVLYADPKFAVGFRIFGQLTLTFRYGRDDEEVMGLRFCNEAIIALKQICPKVETDGDQKEDLSPLQEALVERLGAGAHPFTLEVGIAPPSVQLIPAKRYTGAPIGTHYDVRVFIADPHVDESVKRRSAVRMGVRLIHRVSEDTKCYHQPPSVCTTPSKASLPRCLRLRLSQKAFKSRQDSTDTGETCTGDQWTGIEGPHGAVDKPFLWAEGRVSLKAALNKSVYRHGEQVSATVDVHNESRKIVRKIRVFVVQHVDVCMFSNGKFKNVVADCSISDQIAPGETYHKTFHLIPMRGPTKNWLAVESSLQAGSSSGMGSNRNGQYTVIPAAGESGIYQEIASSAPRAQHQTPEERNVFAIYVSYYVKVKLTLSGMGGELSLKLPFTLGYADSELSDEKTTKKHYSSIMEEEFEHISDAGHQRRNSASAIPGCSSKKTSESEDIGAVVSVTEAQVHQSSSIETNKNPIV